MTNIDKIRRIERPECGSSSYLESLLEQGSAAGLLTASDLERFQLGCIALLARQSDRYNHGRSASVRVETAKALLGSVFFVIGFCLKSQPDLDEAVDMLKNQTPETLFDEGLKRVNTRTASLKALHARIAARLFRTPNVFYRSTVIDGIHGFFKLYRPEFGAQEIHITADYPTFLSVGDLEGIEFIQKYLENLWRENLFCSCFPEENVHHLLCGFDKSYQDLPVNLFEPVFTAALGCALVKKDPRSLRLEKTDLEELYRLFSDRSAAEAVFTLEEALSILSAELSLPDRLLPYLRESCLKIAPALSAACASHQPDKIFILPAYPEKEPAAVLISGLKMDDEVYRRLAEKVLQCRNASQKILLIRENIRSADDLADILADAELDETEILGLLKTLSAAETAVLLKRFSGGADRDAQGFDLPEKEKIISACLEHRLAELPENLRQSIRTLAGRIRFEGADR